jgi:hypothetical protein
MFSCQPILSKDVFWFRYLYSLPRYRIFNKKRREGKAISVAYVGSLQYVRNRQHNSKAQQTTSASRADVSASVRPSPFLVHPSLISRARSSKNSLSITNGQFPRGLSRRLTLTPLTFFQDHRVQIISPVVIVDSISAIGDWHHRHSLIPPSIRISLIPPSIRII